MDKLRSQLPGGLALPFSERRNSWLLAGFGSLCVAGAMMAYHRKATQPFRASAARRLDSAAVSCVPTSRSRGCRSLMRCRGRPLAAPSSFLRSRRMTRLKSSCGEPTLPGLSRCP